MQRRRFVLFILFCALYTFPVQAQTFTVLYDFGSHSGDPIGSSPTTRIAQGRDGNLYSTAPDGGTGNGAIFRMTPAGKLTVLHSFCALAACADGYQPNGGLTLGTDGNFYGTATLGGGTALGDTGTIFKITTAGTFTVLHVLNGTSDGRDPYAPPVEGPDSNFYGTTQFGGGTCDCGTVYKITASGSFHVLYDFVDNGGNSRSPLTLGVDGNLYGTANAGSFRISISGKYALLNASLPSPGPLVQSTDLSFYGAGGTNGEQIFKMTPAGVGTVLHTLNQTTDGAAPSSGVWRASDGNFYGVTEAGGTTTNCSSNLGGCGVIFKITPAGSYSALFAFEDPDGFEPGTILQHTNGNLYGNTAFGGTINGKPSNGGTLYRFSNNLTPFVSLLPYTGKVGSTIGFLGQGFTSASAVSFNGKTATPTSLVETYLTAKVPAGATTGIVSITTSTGVLKSLYKFRVMPQITSFSPASGAIGTAVKITGVSLTQTTSVTFGGVKASSFKVNSDAQVTATVPAAAKTGSIVVITAGGAAISATKFDVKPVITSFTPTSGTVGTKVTIDGTGFGGTTKVVFHGISAPFTVVSSTEVTAMVPTNATTGPITVTTAGGTATSSTSFTVP